jgi:glycosyltransferase involved in cell wall biosynthesis
VLRQTYPHIELIVVNDGSTKNQHLIKPYLSKITYIEQTNKGVAPALNQGIKQAKGEYLVWLSSDDVFDSKKIELQLEFMKNKNALISFTNFNLIDKDNKITAYNVSKIYSDHLEILQTFLKYNPINGCTIMMSRRIIESVGYFNENLRFAQDYEYWMRVALLFPVHYYNVTLTNYRHHQSMGSNLFRVEQMEEFNNVKNKYSKSIKEVILKI